jgi:hypothetical protein
MLEAEKEICDCEAERALTFASWSARVGLAAQV